MTKLPKAVKQSLQKARDSALLAVEVYNKPAVAFKTGCYVTLMVIAWTSLFHAVFLRRKTKPFYRKPNGRFEKVDGECRQWDLRQCLAEYFKSDTQNPVRSNLEFFIPLRNRIEHRSFPELDANIFGECQSMLLNFDDMVEKEFGQSHRIRECLSFALQMFPSSEGLGEAVKRNSSLRSVADFITAYRSSLSGNVLASGQFAFKAFLVQVANHKSQDALAIQFVHYDNLSDDHKEQVDRLVALVKYKSVPVANAGKLKPKDVAKRVQSALGDPKIQIRRKAYDRYNTNWHTCCWRKHQVRPPTYSPNPSLTDTRYCSYDEAHQDYVYTEAWVDLLIEEFKDPRRYEELIPSSLLKRQPEQRGEPTPSLHEQQITQPESPRSAPGEPREHYP